MNPKIYFNLAFIFLMAGVLAVSCEESETDRLNNLVEVRFSPSIGSSRESTRVFGDSWSEGDAVGICMIPAIQPIDADTEVNKYLVTLSGDGTSLLAADAAQRLYYPADDSKVTFTAFYPYAPMNSGTTTVTYNTFADQNTRTGIEAVDFLYHKGTQEFNRRSVDNVNVPLTFSHLFSKFRIIVQTPVQSDGMAVDTTGIALSVSYLPEAATVDLLNGTVAVHTERIVSSFCYNATQSVFEAIVAPHQEVGGKIRTITVSTTNSGTFTYDLQSDQDFVGGNLYTLTLRLSRKGLEQVGNMDVSPWESGITSWETDYISVQSIDNFVVCGEDTDTRNCRFITNYAGNITLSSSEDWAILHDPSFSEDTGLYTYSFDVTAKNTEDLLLEQTATIAIQKEDGAILASKDIKCYFYIAESNCYIMKPGETIYIPVLRGGYFLFHPYLAGGIITVVVVLLPLKLNILPMVVVVLSEPSR